jgi:DNA-directed RNA polymerase subunit RPC12/RpoP
LIDNITIIECGNCKNEFYIKDELKYPLTNFSGKFLTCPYCSHKDSVQDYEEDEVTHEKIKIDNTKRPVDIFSV